MEKLGKFFFRIFDNLELNISIAGFNLFLHKQQKILQEKYNFATCADIDLL